MNLEEFARRGQAAQAAVDQALRDAGKATELEMAADHLTELLMKRPATECTDWEKWALERLQQALLFTLGRK